MTREEAIKVLTNLQNGHGVSYSEDYGLCFGHKWMQAYEKAIAALREQESAKNAHCNSCKKRNSWISVEERLPDKKGEYLTYDQWGYGAVIKTAYWTPKYDGFDEYLRGRAIWHNYDREYGCYELTGITHWMPLPSAPEVEV